MKAKLAAHIPAILTALVVAAMLAGCGGGAPATPTSAPTTPPTSEPIAEPTATAEAATNEPQPVADDWTLHTLEEEGVALSLPPGWDAFDLDKEALGDTMEQLRQANPSMADALSGQAEAMAMQGIKFYALDLESPSLADGFATNLNIMHQVDATLGDLDTAMDQSIAEVEGQFGDALNSEIQKGQVTSASGHTLGRLTYDVSLNTPDGKTLPMSMSQYFASAGGGVYIITLTTMADYRGDYFPMFDAIAEGIYFLK